MNNKPTIKRLASRMPVRTAVKVITSLVVQMIVAKMEKELANPRNYPHPASRPTRGGALAHKRWKKRRAAGIY